MFITLTIDTNIKKPVKIQKSKIHPAKGWRTVVHMKKRGLVQKFKDWRRATRKMQYSLNGQAAMF